MIGRSFAIVAALACPALFAGCNAAVPTGGTGYRTTQGVGHSEPLPENTALPAHDAGPKPRGWLSGAAKTPGRPLLYVAEEAAGEIVIFPERGKLRSPVGTITTGVDDPWGIYVDVHGTLYVANQFANTVTVYPAGATIPSLTLSQDLGRPLYPIADQSGNVFVGNAGDGVGGTVVEYRPGSTSAYTVLHTPGTEVDGMAFDRQGNLYVTYRTPGGFGSIDKFAPGSSQGLVLGMPLNQPQGVVVDNRGNVIAAETGRTSRIDVFPPGRQTPAVTIPLAVTPSELAMPRGDANVYFASESGTVYGCKYPFPTDPNPYPKDEVYAQTQGVALSKSQTI